MRAVVFDLGGTLMEYTGMPLCWSEYYPEGFRSIAVGLSLSPSRRDIERSVQLLERFNPRIRYREEELSPDQIFRDCLAHWGAGDLPYGLAADLFFQGLSLNAHIFEDSVPCLRALRHSGYFTAALTDLPSAMPERLFLQDIACLTGLFDLIVSSQSCGYRKPNPTGLQLIAARAGLPVNELLFVGDEEKDRETARRAGCQFLLLDRAGKSVSSPHSLNELSHFTAI